MALADREAILEYIAQDNVTATIELDEEFEAKAEIARQRPTLYRIAPQCSIHSGLPRSGT
jgi:toxin ParE1/3/4